MNDPRWCVICRRSWSQTQVGEPLWCRDKAQAVIEARNYNSRNQDRSWNAVQAHVVDTWSEGPI